ncbi:hypothetical protein [Carboxylicivirga linearis]|uniref:Uncharacterized protein n=1 Tax=Carboxylicivirga linearis TaxID=1628157 RepID=A0ABS5K417_9BACT|nr:hypothetical protein [Carboxylicivirga linearis]MBS2101251.1 hypothetical protein [Carboxylicivirga linearis]
MKVLVIASLFTAFIALVVYLTSIIAVHGIRKSISDSNYFLRKPYKLVFEIVMWVCGLAIIITGLFIKESADWWVIGGGIGIFLVGVFSDFKRNLFIRIAHYLSAIGGFTLLGLSYYFSFGNIEYTIIIAISALIATGFADKRIWCLELTMAAEIFIGLFYLAHTIM